MTVRFIEGEPPPPGSGRPKAAWRAELIAKPGVWAIVDAIPASVHRSGTDDGFEAVQRTVDGKKVTYARYVGTQQPTNGKETAR